MVEGSYTEVQNLPACAYGRTGKILKIYVSGGNFWKIFFSFEEKKLPLKKTFFPWGTFFWKYFCRTGKFFIFPADSAPLVVHGNAWNVRNEIESKGETENHNERGHKDDGDNESLRMTIKLRIWVMAYLRLVISVPDVQCYWIPEINGNIMIQ